MWIATQIVIFAVMMVVAWFISAYDPRVTGENPNADFARRFTRCGITLALVITAFYGGVVTVFMFAVTGLYWANCGSAFFAHQFHKLFDPEDKREFDPKAIERHLDLLSRLVREGKIPEALDLCGKLEHSGEASPAVLETTHFHLYQMVLDSIATSPVLEESRRLREFGQFNEAESELNRILAGQPQNWAAILLLMRVYAEDFHQPEKAKVFLEPQMKPRLHPAFAKYARRSIDEWVHLGLVRITGEPAQVEAIPDDSIATIPVALVASEVSTDELLKNGQLTTAIDLLEKAAREQPEDFESQLKLAEAHAVYCANPGRASKIVRAMELSGRFTPEQIRQAHAKLTEWQPSRGF